MYPKCTQDIEIAFLTNVRKCNRRKISIFHKQFRFFFNPNSIYETQNSFFSYGMSGLIRFLLDMFDFQDLSWPNPIFQDLKISADPTVRGFFIWLSGRRDDKKKIKRMKNVFSSLLCFIIIISIYIYLKFIN
jgi:hypothetical protein